MALDKNKTNEEEELTEAEENAEADAAFLDPPFPYRAMPAPDWAVVDNGDSTEERE